MGRTEFAMERAEAECAEHKKTIVSRDFTPANGGEDTG